MEDLAQGAVDGDVAGFAVLGLPEFLDSEVNYPLLKVHIFPFEILKLPCAHPCMYEGKPYRSVLWPAVSEEPVYLIEGQKTRVPGSFPDFADFLDRILLKIVELDSLTKEDAYQAQLKIDGSGFHLFRPDVLVPLNVRRRNLVQIDDVFVRYEVKKTAYYLLIALAPGFALGVVDIIEELPDEVLGSDVAVHRLQPGAGILIVANHPALLMLTEREEDVIFRM